MKERDFPGHPGPRGPRYDYVGEPGSQGANGAVGERAPEPESNSAGLAGKLTLQDDSCLSPDFFGEQLSPLYAQMAFREAFNAHVNEDWEGTARRLVWLYNLLEPETARVNNSSGIIDADDPKQDTVPDHEFQDFRRNTISQLKRLELGLNAYGDPTSFIPAITYKFYKDYTDRWLDSAKRIEIQYLEFDDKNRDQSSRITNVKKASTELDALVANLRQDIVEAENSREALQDDIRKMALSIEAAAAQLMSAGKDFQSAIERESGGCDFADILKGIQTVCSVGSTAISFGTSIGPLIKTIRHRDDRKFNVYANDIIAKVETARGSVDGLRGAYSALAERFKSGPTPHVPSDAARILANRAEVEETIRKFRSLPESEPYQAAINTFVALVDTRNNKIQQHDALVTQAADKLSAINRAKSDQVSLRRNLAVSTDPTLPIFLEFMQRTLDVYKTEIVRSLFYLQRALRYITLSSAAIEIDRSTVQHLELAYSLLDKQLLRASEQRGRAHQTLNFGNPVASFSLLELAGAEGIRSLKEGHSIDFAIPADAFRDFNHVFATDARVQFVGTDQGTHLGLRLVHTGYAKFFNNRGASFEFTHPSRTTFVYQNVDTGSSLGQDDEFIALTPYGPWRVDLNLVSNKKIDISGLQDIRLEFRLKFLGN